MNKKLLTKATTFVVKFWDENGKCIKELAFPKYKFSLNDVTSYLKGKEDTCDIYECRYDKNRSQYITNGRTIVWNGDAWVTQM